VIADGRTRTLYADNRKAKTNNGNADVQAKWDGDRLVVETTLGRDVTVKETYALIADATRLVVTTEIDMGGRGSAPAASRGGGRGVRRVYDRAAGPIANEAPR